MNTQHFKELLETEKRTLEEELSTVARKNPSQKGDWEAIDPPGDIDRADEDEVAENIDQYETNIGIVNQLEPRLAEVNAALEKIENRTYGVCEVGGEAIEEDRLEAKPAATTCKAHME